MKKYLLSASLLLALSTNANAGIFDGFMNSGSSDAKTEATGSASGSNAEGENKSIPKCTEPLGTVAIQEDTNSPWYYALTTEHKLTSTVPVIKEGKVIVAAFTDSLSNMIKAAKNYKAQKIKGGLGTGGSFKVQQD